LLLLSEEEDLELLMKKQLWSDSNDALSNLNFQCLAMDSPWMCLQQQQRPELTLPSPHNEDYRALAAAALQEMRSRDASNKQLLAQAPMQMWQQQQPPPQAQQQQHQHQQQQLKQGMHQMGGVVPAGPLLQLPGSQPQSPMDLGGGVSSQAVSRSLLQYTAIQSKCITGIQFCGSRFSGVCTMGFNTTKSDPI
jgi:hypothetical protein